MKYYFVYYSCYRINRPNFRPVNSDTAFYQSIINIHPIAWQLECNILYDREQQLGNGTYSENYKVISWQELSKEEYDLYKDRIG